MYLPDFVDRVSDRAAEVVLDAIARGHAPKDARVLEVGCGNGRFLRAVKVRDAAHSLRVTGVDVLDEDLALARAYGGSPRLPWYPPAPPRAGGYDRVVNFDITDAEGLARELRVGDRGRYDLLVSVSTLFWMGFPGDSADGPLPDDEKELGADCLRGLAAHVLKPGAAALVMTAGWYDWGHALDEALRDGDLKEDFLVLRRGAMAFHAKANGTVIDLPFYRSLPRFKPPPSTERVILDEVDLAMDYEGVAPELRDATRFISIKPTFERYMTRPSSGPFWLLRHDPAAARRALASSDVL